MNWCAELATPSAKRPNWVLEMPDQTILLDIGNARTKLVLTDAKKIKAALKSGAISSTTLSPVSFSHLDEIADWIKKQNCSNESLQWQIASVNRPQCDALLNWIAGNRQSDSFRLIDHTLVPIRTEVRFRERVGIDRLLAAWAAHQFQSSKQACIVVDAGTAVTIDYVNLDGTLLGGNIFPGLVSSLKNLRQSTAALPEIAIAEAPDYCLGRDTTEAITSGVFHSQIGAICYLVNKIQSEFGECKIITTGGAIHTLQSRLPADWQHAPNLVLTGIAALPG